MFWWLEDEADETVEEEGAARAGAVCVRRDGVAFTELDTLGSAESNIGLATAAFLVPAIIEGGLLNGESPMEMSTRRCTLFGS